MTTTPKIPLSPGAERADGWEDSYGQPCRVAFGSHRYVTDHDVQLSTG